MFYAQSISAVISGRYTFCHHKLLFKSVCVKIGICTILKLYLKREVRHFKSVCAKIGIIMYNFKIILKRGSKTETETKMIS